MSGCVTTGCINQGGTARIPSSLWGRGFFDALPHDGGTARFWRVFWERSDGSRVRGARPDPGRGQDAGGRAGQAGWYRERPSPQAGETAVFCVRGSRSGPRRWGFATRIDALRALNTAIVGRRSRE